MDFAQQQRKPGKHLVGIGFVVLLHVGIVYALINGLAKEGIKLIQKELEVKLIDEPPPPPPPEEPKEIPPPPDVKAPPPPPESYVPPPEVQVAAPVQVPQMAVQNTAPPAVETPPVPPPPPKAEPAPQQPATVAGACSNASDTMQTLGDKWSALADKEGITDPVPVRARVLIGTGGEVKDVQITQAGNSAVGRLAASGLRRLKCQATGTDYWLLFETTFRLAD